MVCCCVIGVLVTTVLLDYEETRQFVLTVQAVDGGQPPLTGTAIVRITVIDENDHAPQFANSAYVVMVIENTDVGSQVMKVRNESCSSLFMNLP